MMRGTSSSSIWVVFLLFLISPRCSPFTPSIATTGSRIPLSPLSASKKETGSIEEKNTKSPLELASWYAVEAFGKAFGSGSNKNGDTTTKAGDIDITVPPSSLKETLQRIQLDNDRSYFLSGEVDRLIYDEKCTFADPFVSFDGRDRFIENLANLGSFITNYDAKMIKYDVEEDGSRVDTKVGDKVSSQSFGGLCE